MRFWIFDSCLQIRTIPLGRRNAPPMERGRARRRERIFSHLSVRVSGWRRCDAACTKTHSLYRPKISSIAVWGTDLGGAPIAVRLPAGWMQRVRRRIERLLRRATQKRNSDGESISGMSGTDFHAIFSHVRPSAFWPRLTRTNTHWRTWIFFRSPYPASARGIDQPGGRLHTFLSYRHCLTAMVVGSTGPPHHLTLE